MPPVRRSNPKDPSATEDGWDEAWRDDRSPHLIPCYYLDAGIDLSDVIRVVASAIAHARRALDPPQRITPRGIVLKEGEANAIEEAMSLADELVGVVHLNSAEAIALAKELRRKERLEILCHHKHVASAFRYWVFAVLALSNASNPEDELVLQASNHIKSAIDYAFHAVRLADPVIPTNDIPNALRAAFTHILRSRLTLERARRTRDGQ